MNRIRFQCLGPECSNCCDGGKHGSAVKLTGGDFLRLDKDIRRVNLKKLAPGNWAISIPAGGICALWEEGKGCSVHERSPELKWLRDTNLTGWMCVNGTCSGNHNPRVQILLF